MLRGARLIDDRLRSLKVSQELRSPRLVTRYTCHRPSPFWEILMRHLLVPLLSFACSAAFAYSGPAEVVQNFYTARLASQNSGVPSGRELADFSTYLGPELVCLLGAALRYDDKFELAHPGEKPPFAEGDLYSSSVEIPTRFTLGALHMQGGSASLPVHFYLDQADKPDTQGWQDLVHLKVIRKRWQITDIEYQGGTAFGNQGQLFSKLRETLVKATPVAGWNVRELDSCTLDKVAPAKSKSKAKGKHATKGKSKVAGKSKAVGKSKTVSKSTTPRKASAATASKKKTQHH
ncbi:MAG: hypothetical protein H6R19_95 [Proteobacteria bacterium]|nr:hypothetical protein [Pseudomonadota bacterium]